LRCIRVRFQKLLMVRVNWCTELNRFMSDISAYNVPVGTKIHAARYKNLYALF